MVKNPNKGKEKCSRRLLRHLTIGKKIRRGGLQALLMTFAVNQEIVGRIKQAGCFVAEKKVGVLMRLIQSEWWLTTLSPGLELLQILWCPKYPGGQRGCGVKRGWKTNVATGQEGSPVQTTMGCVCLDFVGGGSFYAVQDNPKTSSIFGSWILTWRAGAALILIQSHLATPIPIGEMGTVWNTLSYWL